MTFRLYGTTGKTKTITNNLITGFPVKGDKNDFLS